jgi:hypothetical protein
MLCKNVNKTVLNIMTPLPVLAAVSGTALSLVPDLSDKISYDSHVL